MGSPPAAAQRLSPVPPGPAHAQVNAFFLKFILWIPPLNPLNTLRLLVLFLAALPTAKEYYAFCDESSSTQCFLLPFPPFPLSLWSLAGPTHISVFPTPMLWQFRYGRERRQTSGSGCAPLLMG